MGSVNILMAASGGFNWYGFLIGSGMVACIVIAYFMAKKRGYYKDIVFDIAIICIPFAIVGARLYYVIFDIIGNPGKTWTFLEIIGFSSHGLSGLAIYGGLIGACLGAIIIAVWKKHKPGEQRVTFMQMADLAFTTVLLGQAIGRWGNFANGEAYGNLVTNVNLQWFPYAVKIGEEFFQATFFYESMWNMVGFGVLLWLYNGKRKSFDGFILSCYCIFYGVGRFFIEGLRSDSLYLIPGVIRVSQVVSILIILFGIGYILAHLYMARSRRKKPFIFVDEKLLNDSYFGYSQSVLAHPIRYVKKKKLFSAEALPEKVSDEEIIKELDEISKTDILEDISDIAEEKEFETDNTLKDDINAQINEIKTDKTKKE